MTKTRLEAFSDGVIAILITIYILAHTLVAEQGPDSRLAHALGRDRKGKLSVALWAIGIALSFINPWMAVMIYVGVALMWLVPDRRIEKRAHAA